MRREEQRLIKKNECWFRRITPAFAKRYPQYTPFVGMFLLMEDTNHLERGAIVTEITIFAEQVHHQGHSHSAESCHQAA